MCEWVKDIRIVDDSLVFEKKLNVLTEKKACNLILFLLISEQKKKKKRSTRFVVDDDRDRAKWRKKEKKKKKKWEKKWDYIDEKRVTETLKKRVIEALISKWVRDFCDERASDWRMRGGVIWFRSMGLMMNLIIW